MSAHRTVSELQAKLAELKERQKQCLEKHLVWSMNGLNDRIIAIEFAMGLREDL